MIREGLRMASTVSDHKVTATAVATTTPNSKAKQPTPSDSWKLSEHSGTSPPAAAKLNHTIELTASFSRAFIIVLANGFILEFAS